MSDFKLKELNNRSVTDVAKDVIGNGLKALGGWLS